MKYKKYIGQQRAREIKSSTYFPFLFLISQAENNDESKTAVRPSHTHKHRQSDESARTHMLINDINNNKIDSGSSSNNKKGIQIL